MICKEIGLFDLSVFFVLEKFKLLVLFVLIRGFIWFLMKIRKLVKLLNKIFEVNDLMFILFLNVIFRS